MTGEEAVKFFNLNKEAGAYATETEILKFYIFGLAARVGLESVYWFNINITRLRGRRTAVRHPPTPPR
jgi:hypothetical protein